MKILSLFDGISCARVALERAGIPVEVYYASEIDKYAMQISQKNYPDIIQIGDVKEVKNYWEFMNARPDIDLLIGGSPCQDLSIAKKNREGLDGSRSSLFWDYVRILNEIKPKYFILENVASMPKEAKQVITETLGVEPIMINASLVSAQNRKRLFWTNIPGVTQPEDKGILLKDILENKVDEKYNVNISEKYGTKGLCGLEEKSKSMTASMYKGYGNDGVSLIKTNIQDKVKVRKYPVDITKLKILLREHKNITNKEIAEKLNQPITKVEHWFRTDGSFAIPDEDIWFQLKDLLNIKTDEFDKPITEFEIRDGKFDMSKRVYSVEGKSPTITTITGGQQHKIINDTYQIRKLTPIECERLQGLPDNYTEGVSNTQRYKALGNAFNVDVVAHILNFIK